MSSVHYPSFEEIIELNMADHPGNAPVLRGIREGYHLDDEIVEWIKHGKIRPYIR
ncbi:MAG: hypothetical protein V1728_04410 [Candidatus Micrarchaeota archaeon]